MIEAFSPGPWTSDGQKYVFDREDKAVAMTLAKGRYGDAELIAAAPEMLSVLRLVASYIDKRVDGGTDTMPDIIHLYGRRIQPILQMMEMAEEIEA